MAPEAVRVGVAHHAGLAAPDYLKAMTELGECILDKAINCAGPHIGGQQCHRAQVIGEIIIPR